MWLSSWPEMLVFGLGCNIERTNQGNGWAVHWFSEMQRRHWFSVCASDDVDDGGYCIRMTARMCLRAGHWTVKLTTSLSVCLSVCVCLCLCGWTIVKVTSNWRHQRRTWSEIVHRSLWYKPAIMGARRHGQEGALAPPLWKCKVFLCISGYSKTRSRRNINALFSQPVVGFCSFVSFLFSD